jgi:hypothetical protein
MKNIHFPLWSTLTTGELEIIEKCNYEKNTKTIDDLK